MVDRPESMAKVRKMAIQMRAFGDKHAIELDETDSLEWAKVYHDTPHTGDFVDGGLNPILLCDFIDILKSGELDFCFRRLPIKWFCKGTTRIVPIEPLTPIKEPKMRGNAERMWTIEEYDQKYTEIEKQLSQLTNHHRCLGNIVDGYAELVQDRKELFKEIVEIKDRYSVGLLAIQAANKSFATVESLVQVAREALCPTNNPKGTEDEM